MDWEGEGDDDVRRSGRGEEVRVADLVKARSIIEPVTSFFRAAASTFKSSLAGRGWRREGRRTDARYERAVSMARKW